MVDKMSQLEDQIFEMDREFEGHTARQKRKYDTTLRNELQSLSERLKAEYLTMIQQLGEEYEQETESKLEIQEGRLTQKFLQEKFEYLKDNGEKKRVELAKVLEDQAKLSAANEELEEALMASKREIDHLVGKKKGWLPF